MTAPTPGGDSRFGAVPSPGAPGSFGAPAPSVGSGFSPPPPSTQPVVPDPAPAGQEGGFLLAPVSATAGERRQLGAPKWLYPTILGGLAVVVLAFVGVYFLQSQHAKTDKSVFAHTTLSIPEAAAGLTHGIGPGVQNAEAQTTLALAANGVVSSVSGGYLDADGSSAAFIAAGKRVTAPTALDSAAESAKDKWVSGVAGSGTQAAVNLTVQDPGSLGGVMQCGATQVAGVPATFCVAVDQGSIAEILVAGDDVKAAAATARTLRTAVVQRTS